MKSLVTGGAGFIGSHVVDELIRMGHEVVVLDDLSGGFKENVNPRATLVTGSIMDMPAIDELFDAHRFDYVFHLAAYAAEGLSHFIRRFNYENNLIGSINLINASVNHDVKCFVFTSSIAVYGKNQLPMTEAMEPMPEDPYGIAKHAVERDLRSAHELFGLPYVIFRPHNVYGERQNAADPYRNVIAIFLNQIFKDKALTIFGNGEQTRAFTHVRDVAPIIAQAVDRTNCYGEVFNIGAEKPYTINQLVALISKALEKTPSVVNLPERQEVVHAFADHSKLTRFFGERPPPVDLETGLAAMIQDAKDQLASDRKPRIFTNLDISKNLPPSWRSLTGREEAVVKEQTGP